MRWFVDYLDSEGNWGRYSVEAFDKKEAEQKALQKYYDIDIIVDIHRKLTKSKI